MKRRRYAPYLESVLRKMFKAGARGMAGAVLAGALTMTNGWAAELEPPPPANLPPPPRMLDPATATVEGEAGTLPASQRQHCLQLLDRINALPAGPQWSQGSGQVTTADGRQYSTLERAPERKRLEEAYRQECAQEKR